MADDKQGALTELARKVAFWPTLLVILGLLLGLLGLTGGITSNNFQLTLPGIVSQAIAGAAGLCLLVFGLWEQAREQRHVDETKAVDPETLRVTIIAPEQNEVVNESIVVRGSMKGELPDSYRLHVFRMYPEGFVPLRPIEVDKATRAWKTTDSCDIGFADKRDFAVFAVGPSGAALLEYYREANKAHNAIRDKLVAYTQEMESYSPLIKNPTTDMVQCDRVTVRRDPTPEEVRKQLSVRDIAFLTTAIFVQHYPKYVSDQSVKRAPPGENWQPETEADANRRAERLIKLGLLHWRGPEVETTAYGRNFAKK